MSRPSATLKLPRWVQRLGEMPQVILDEAIDETREFARDKLRENASKGGARGLHVRSGKGIKSIRTYKKRTAKGAEINVGMNFYMWVHNKGAVITPKKADRLTFFIPGVGWRSSKRVVLPARFWVDDAMEATQKEFGRYVYRAIERFTRG